MNTIDLLAQEISSLCRKAKEAAPTLASARTEQKNAILSALASLLSARQDDILAANTADLSAAKENGIQEAMLDRLSLNTARIEGLISSLHHVISLPDPVGSGEHFTRPNGLVIDRVKVPLGVVGMIYEARPNVTVDAAALCLKTGNAVILRGGKEAIHTNKALVVLIKQALSDSGFSEACVGLITDTTRDSAKLLMTQRGLIDVLIPRGSAGLIKTVVENATVPVIETGAGNCHLYVDKAADPDMALRIAVNAKTSRPAVCNAIENLLVHRAVAEKFLPMFASAMAEKQVEIRGCADTLAILPGCKAATEEDFFTEYDDYIISVKVVDSLDAAISHINTHSTGHSEAIVTEDFSASQRFLNEINSAAVYVNASTRFTDGGEFGFGAEIGISTQKLHARGPMGLSALTTDKYLIRGCGQVR